MFAISPLKSIASAALSLALVACTVAKPSQVQLETQLQTSAEAIIEPWVLEDAPGVAVAVSKGGEVIFARGAGIANLEHGEPITPDSVFQVASVSKQFTAFATLLLVSEGKIDLSEDIRTYVPELTEHPKTITVRHLLDHTGGLREAGTLTVMAGWLDDDIRTHQQVIELIARQDGVNFEAGEEVEYSNTGYILLAEIVERASGMPFEQFTEERIFAPLGMNNTRFQTNRNDLIPGRASSYYLSNDGFKNVISAGERKGSTGLYTTALDMLKWTENFQTKKIGNDTVFDLMAERTTASNNDASTFARGQELRPYNGLKTWSHGGRDVGYRSFVLRIPEEEFALTILSNRTDFDTAKMAFALTDVFLGNSSNYQAEELVSWEPTSKAQLQKYAGNYELYPGAVFTIFVDGHGLKFASFGAPKGEGQLLPQVGQHRFMLSPDADISIAFEAPQNGQSLSFSYTIGLHGSLKANRVALVPFDPATVNFSDYTGTYESTELGTGYTLTLKEGILVAKHHRSPEFALTPYQTDIFFGQGPLQKLEFTRDSNGDVAGMRASAPLSEDVYFMRSGRCCKSNANQSPISLN